MIIKMQIRDELTSEEAILQYDDTPNQKVIWGLVDGSDELREKIEEYFSNDRDYRIPTGDGIDEYEPIQGSPLKAVQFFEMAMCEMLFEINVRMVKALNVENE